MTPPSQLPDDHVTVLRLWKLAKYDDELRMEELDHISACEICRDTLRVCVGARTFGTVLKKLREPDKEE